jgi:L-lactate dehydrogenase (cytochrome)
VAARDLARRAGDQGIQSGTDAKRVVDAGRRDRAVQPRGRQLDRAAVPLELVSPFVDAVGGRADVLVDTGILHGGDIVAAVALGAQAALVGRAHLYGLMAGGRRGVLRAVEILRAEMERTMALIGVSRVDDLRRHHVRVRLH